MSRVPCKSWRHTTPEECQAAIEYYSGILTYKAKERNTLQEQIRAAQVGIVHLTEDVDEILAEITFYVEKRSELAFDKVK